MKGKGRSGPGTRDASNNKQSIQLQKTIKKSEASTGEAFTNDHAVTVGKKDHTLAQAGVWAERANQLIVPAIKCLFDGKFKFSDADCITKNAPRNSVMNHGEA